LFPVWLIALLALSIASAAEPASRPNIVVILSDDQPGMGTLSVMPNVGAWIRDAGTQFFRGYIVDPLCCPSRAALLTGQYSHNNGVWDNQGPEGADALVPTISNTLGVWLQIAGYRTAYIGKFLNNYPTNLPTPLGWSTFVRLLEGYYTYGIWENGTTTNYVGPPLGVNDYYSTDQLADRAVATLGTFAQNPGQPFFMVIAPYGPHNSQPEDPLGQFVPIPAHRHENLINPDTVVIPSLAGAYEETDFSGEPLWLRNEVTWASIPGPHHYRDPAFLRRYFALMKETLMSVDDLVGRVMNQLSNSGVLNNTIVIYYSDNGHSIGHHGHFGKRAPFNEVINVPMLVRGPGYAVNQIRTEMVSNLDLVATIVEAAGAIPGRALDGVSLQAILQGQVVPWRDTLLIEGQAEDPSTNPPTPYRWRGLQSSDTTYVRYDTTNEEQLYFEYSDNQLTNFAMKMPTRAANLLGYYRTKLSGLQNCAGSACWVRGSALP